MPTPLYQTFTSGHWAAGEGHELYVETYGSPTGLPVLFVHGGPGLGCSDADKRFFDPVLYRVIFFDQRGSGRSRPYGATENNTPEHLVRDIEGLLDWLELDQVLLFGGSWGSALSLLFGIAHPERVRGMVLRAIFPATAECIELFVGGAVEPFYPVAWRRFRDQAPKDQQQNLAAYYYQMMDSEDDTIRQKFAFEWALYGGCIGSKSATTGAAAAFLETFDYLAMSKLEALYSRESCFLPDNYIIDHAQQIGDIPVYIVQGRYDMLCPPVYAIDLHERLSNSQLFVVDAGHVSSEPAIEKQLFVGLAEMHASLTA